MADIYLDYAATSLKHFDIIEKNLTKLKDLYANPNSNHNLGKKNAKLLKEAREKIAKSINAEVEEIIFTSGGTESNNTVFNHILNNFSSGEIIISNVEHSSIRECAKVLENKGFKIIELAVNKEGIISLTDLENKLTNKTVLVSIMLANNETGALEPLENISKLLKKKSILFHSDIVQAYGKVEIDVKQLGLDFASVSGHKIGSLNNFGFLYAKNGNVVPLIHGGGQERGIRSGTSDVLGAMVLADCYEETILSIHRLRELKNYFINSLANRDIDFEINGSLENSLPNILNIYFKNIEAQRLITFLDANNIYISGGSACGSGNIKGSRIITLMYDEDRATHSVRISIGFEVTEQIIEIVVEKISNLENRLKERNN